MSGDRPVRGETVIVETCERVDGELTTEVTAYLMGGGAMTLRGHKDATKDVDVLVSAATGFEALREALTALGYEPVPEMDLSVAYRDLGAQLILEADDGVRFDVFDRKVVGKIELTEPMADRARAEGAVYEGEWLVLYPLAAEDIYLFKGMANRQADAADMRTLVQATADFEYGTVMAELERQLPLNTGAVEAEMLVAGEHPLLAFEQALHASGGAYPTGFIEDVAALADRAALEQRLVAALVDGTSLAAAREAVEQGEEVTAGAVEAAVDRLREKGVIEERDGEWVVVRAESE
jgi:hypothetical protein